MQTPQSPNLQNRAQSDWLRTYFFLRAGVSIAWILLALTVGVMTPTVGAALLVIYPAWDALANYMDAGKTGGLRSNRSQALNFGVSAATAIAVLAALVTQVVPVLAVFGVWAVLSGAFQLTTGLRRWKAGGQWAMVLSGAQSVLAGVFFVVQSRTAPELAATTVAPYAGFGAFYFLVSAIWLTVKARRSGGSGLAA
jgi:uncharacterized membrane protein HdeD (DUF308 family)